MTNANKVLQNLTKQLQTLQDDVPHLNSGIQKGRRGSHLVAPGVKRDATVLGAELYPEALGGGEYPAIRVELIHPMSLVLGVDPVLGIED